MAAASQQAHVSETDASEIHPSDDSEMTSCALPGDDARPRCRSGGRDGRIRGVSKSSGGESVGKGRIEWAEGCVAVSGVDLAPEAVRLADPGFRSSHLPILQPRCARRHLPAAHSPRLGNAANNLSPTLPYFAAALLQPRAALPMPNRHLPLSTTMPLTSSPLHHPSLPASACQSRCCAAPCLPPSKWKSTTSSSSAPAPSA